MERAFIINKESKYYKDLHTYYDLLNNQKDFICKFFNENNIESKMYRMGGNGRINEPFKECDKKEIYLSIIPTKQDLVNFESILNKKEDSNGCRSFKKNCNLAKKFAQECIENQIVINAFEPRVADYFDCIYGCRYSRFEYNHKLYVKIDNELLNSIETPEGFQEIKLSEFHSMLEIFEQENKDEEQ
ncbi:hypothetical protein [Anaerovorax sp. IOR16]|uniref:hypothetical protein n=1 Tax=Anaerovorax sp. IOR16 TaxID=2773458 RepID=UPI0019CF65ED|nr:hypothetical protein [Anaerovorax sp. IOR16]